jgi:tetratricopeptide (TPR) repeat protein
MRANRMLVMVCSLMGAVAAFTTATKPCWTQVVTPKDQSASGRLQSRPDAVVPGCTDLMERHGATPAELTLALDNCGNAYFKKFDYDRAIEEYSQAIKISPQFNTAWNNRGSAYLAKHDYARAIQDFSQAIRIKPGYLTGSVDPTPFDYATVFVNRGNAYAVKHENDRAIEDYSQAIRLKPNDASAFYGRGLVYSAMADYDHAIADYGEALQIDAKDADALCSRGVAYFHKNDYDRAMQDFNEAIRLKPDDADAFYDRGILSNTQGHYDSAIADYDQALQIDPESAFALYSRAIAERNEDDPASARADQAAALEIDPNIASKVGAIEVTVATAKNDSAQSHSVPACMALGGGVQAVGTVPSYVDEPIFQLKRMAPGLKGIKVDAEEKPTDHGTAGAEQDKTTAVLNKTGAVIAGLLHRMPDLIASEEVRQPIATRAIGDVGLDGRLMVSGIGAGVTAIAPRAIDYEAHIFTYRIVHRQSASGANVFDEFRTDARDRPIDYSAQEIRKPFSIGFATTWLFFLPDNLHEFRFRYLGQQWLGDFKTYVLAFAQDPSYSGLNAVIDSAYDTCSTPLQGIAWIDQSTFQIDRIQTDLLSPLPSIQLNQLRSVVDYGPVKIHELNRTLWLPNEVETSWQTAYGLGQELHLYSHYRLFHSTARILPAGGSSPR